MKRGIDIQRVHLAEHFLGDVEHTEAELQDLADMIQSVVDDFFFQRGPDVKISAKGEGAHGQG